jgi:uncharacterized membrane protein YkvA (DUF1232 family)
MAFGRTTFSEDDEDPARMTRDEERVRRGFWVKARRVAAGLPFAEDLLAAYYCAFDRSTPLQVKASLLAALAYFVLPFDFIPDFLPVLGYTDDAAVLAAAIRLVATHILPAHRDAARETLSSFRGVA